MLGVAGLAPLAHAASGTWSGAADSVWSNTSNWSASPVPGTGDTATFNSAGSGNTTLDLGAGVTVGTVLFDTSSAAAYTIGSSAVGSQTLTFGTVNGGITVNATVASNQLVNANIALATTGNYNATNNSTTNALTLAGGISASSTGAKTLTVTGNGNTTISGAIANGAGTMNLTKTGTGTLTISGTNTYTGGTRANAGTTILSGSHTQSGTADFISVNNVGAQNAVLKVASGAGTQGYTDINLAEAANARGAIYQQGGTFSAAAGIGLRVGSGATSYGYYNLSSGSLSIGGAKDTAIGYGNGATGVMDVTGGSVAASSWIVLGRNGGTASGLLNVTGGSVTSNTNNIALNWGGTSGALSILKVGGGAGAAAVTGVSSATNYLDVSQSNVAGTTGVVNVLPNGTLTVAQVRASNAGSTALFNFNGGTLKATATNFGAAFMTNANVDAVTVYGGGGTIHNNGTNITISNVLGAASGSGVTSISVTDGGSGYIGAPMVKITGGTGNTATGYAVMVDDGTGNGTYKVDRIVITSPGTYSVAPTTVTLNGGGATTGATIGGITTGTNTVGGMTFTGSGTTTLSGVNTYGGNTTIDAGGTLALASTGSIANSANIIANGTFNVSAVTGFAIGSSQTLKGSGTITGATTVNGTLAPGNSPGLLTFSGNLSLGSSSTSVFEINGADTGRGSTYDAINAGGALSYGGTMSLVFDAPITAGSFDLFLGAGGGALSSTSGTFGNVSVSGSFAQAFTAPAVITGSGWTASSANWIYAFDNATGELAITSAVPEPSAFAALAGLVGLAAVGARRRRR